MLNVLCALLQLYIYSHYGVINEQVMPPLPRHEYGRMGAVCRRSRGMGNEKVNSQMPSLNSRSMPFVVFMDGFPSRCQNLIGRAIRPGDLLFNFPPLFPTFHHGSQLFANFSHFSLLFPTFSHFSQLFTTFPHFLPLFATFSHFSLLFTTFHHFFPLFPTFSTFSTFHYFFTTFSNFSNFSPLFPSCSHFLPLLATFPHFSLLFPNF